MARAGFLASFALACLLGAGAAWADTGAGDDRVWRVVLIRSWDSLYPMNIMRETALRNAVVEGAARVVEFFPEEIDPIRFEGDYEREFAQLLARKYGRMKIDVVVASGIEPQEFATRHRDTIWPGASIVFNGVFEGALDGWKRPPRSTGVMVPLDIEGTLQLGQALVPAARRVHVISGSSSFDLHIRELVHRKLARSTTALEIHRIEGLTRAQTVERLAALGPTDLVVYLTMLRDGGGQLSGPVSSAIPYISERSPVPVMSPFHTQLRRGPAGGSTPRIDQHGAYAGKLVRRILEGEDPERIAIDLHPAPACEVDWKALERWHVPMRNVPARCTVAHAPSSIWRDYFWPVVGLLAVIVAQALLIHALLLQSRRRRRAEEQLRAASGELSHVARLSMVGALTASIAHEINQPMGAILSNTEAAQMMLEQGTLDPDKLREILADIRSEDLRAAEVIRSLRKLLSRQDWSPVALDINEEVAKALSHLAFDAARRDVQIAPLFGRRLPVVDGVAVQVQQVVINLVVNAMEALVSATRREVRVETLARNGGVEIVVADHGPGLDPAAAEHIFETNFTTKSDGMGFGLSIVRTIVKEHRGRVSFEANVPRGAIFRVWLPAVGT